MAHPIEKIEEEIEKPRRRSRSAAEAERRSRTPWLVLGGVQIVRAGALVVVVLAIVFTVYLLA